MSSRIGFRMPVIAPAAGVLVLAAVALAASGCNRKASDDAPQQQGPEPVVVTLQPTVVQPLQRTVEVVGTLYGDEEAVISAKVSGRVVQAFKEMGDRARFSEPLAQIDRTDYELARTNKELMITEALSKLGLKELPTGEFDPANVPTVQKAKLQAANAEARYLRGKKLFEKSPPLISEQDFADLQTTYEVARTGYDVELLTARSLLAEARTRQSDLNMTVQRLEDTTVRAPSPEESRGAAGRSATRPAEARYAVAARMVSVGEYVREGTPLFRLVADDPIKFRAKVPERHFMRVRVGQEVSVSVEGLPTPFVGGIARVSPHIDAANRSFEIEVVIPNDKGVLKPGAFARGSILVDTDADVTFVPLESVVTYAGTNKVFVVKDGKAEEVVIQPGRRKGEYMEVVKGMAGRHEVVVSGATKLAPGAPVVVKTLEQIGGVTRPAVQQPQEPQSANAATEVVR